MGSLPAPAQVLAPSDLRTPGPGGIQHVGGRVLEVASGGVEVLLGDAFAIARFTLDEPSSLLAGDLAVVEARFDADPQAERARGSTRARLLEVHRPRARRDGDPGDVARFVDQGVGARLMQRSAAARAVRDWFDLQGFLEVDTPAMIPSPGLDLHLDAFEVRSEPPAPDRYLQTSPEYQMKRLLTGGVPRCYQLARCFRRGEAGSRHNPEFVMLEWYRSFAGVEAVIEDTIEIVRAVARALGCGGELPPTTAGGRAIDISSPFERLTVCEAFERYADVDGRETMRLSLQDEETFFRLLVDRVEPRIAEATTPVILTEYPAAFASLARRCPERPEVAERFEVYVGGVEICNGFGELTDPTEQRARLERDREHRRARGLPVYPIDERFLNALEEGMPPAAGNALGFDRLVALCLGARRLADVMAFPEAAL